MVGPEPKLGESRFYVTLCKRGKRVTLTLNGSALFKDADLATRGAKAAMTRDGWRRAVIQELVLEERKDGDGKKRVWCARHTTELTAKEAARAD